MQIFIPRRLLAAVSRAMASKDIRYYLNGLYLEVAAGAARLTATDGSIAMCGRFKTDATERLAVIIPADAIGHAVKAKSETVELLAVGGGFSLAGLSFKPVEGVYPDYRRIFPRTVSGEPGRYSVELLAAFGKAGKDMKHKGSPIVRQNGPHNAAVVHFYDNDDFMGVIMPLRPFTEKYPDTGVPTWAADL